MFKRLVMTFWMLIVLTGIVTERYDMKAQAQDDEVLRVLAIDYLGEALQNALIEDRGFKVELTTVNRQDLESIVTEGQLQDFDLVLSDNQTIDPIILDHGLADSFAPICDILPDLCAPPIPIDLCARFPWLPICGDPCPPNALFCPPIIVWDKTIVVDPWPPMTWTVDDFINVINTETVMVDPRNMVGFYPEPAIFEVTRPSFTTNLEGAYLAFTPACNYVMHYDEFNGLGFQPIVVEGYQETPFNVGAYGVNGGNIELTAAFTSLLLSDVDIQRHLFEATGLLPSNVEVLGEILPK